MWEGNHWSFANLISILLQGSFLTKYQISWKLPRKTEFNQIFKLDTLFKNENIELTDDIDNLMLIKINLK